MLDDCSDSSGSADSKSGAKAREPQWPQRLGNYWLEECLGSGYSGSIFRAVNVHTRQIVALKVQLTSHECRTNIYERGFYPSLQGGLGMPTLYADGVQGSYDYLAIELLGSSLDTLFRKSGKDVMDLRSVCSIAMQLISRLECMHNRGILHRDIQLGNCVIGIPPNTKTLYMIDFGFSKRYIDPITGAHIPDSRAKRDFIGNYWFSSVRVHCEGRVPSRRDDMEALALMLIHLVTPSGLKWVRKGVPTTTREHDNIIRQKRTARPSELCLGLPSVFEEFLRYCRKLGFESCPNYRHWREEFRDLAIEHGFGGDDAFLWPPPRPEKFVRALGPTKSRKATVGTKPADVEGVLNRLAKLDLALAQRPVLGNVANAPHPPRPSPVLVNGDKARKKPVSQELEKVIVISSDGENGGLGQKAAAMRLPKAIQLGTLARMVPDATDNLALARLIRNFVDILESSRSRSLTKEGFTFLDALHQQLADPDVYVVPLRTSRTRTETLLDTAPEADARRAKMDRLFRLRRDVGAAKSNRMLAKMVTEFGTCIDQSKGRTITKDALGFLHGLSDTLRAMP
ncbi:hypothetical protein PHLCEN_2v13591 [Hermanssonia centrifuga]|uniref:Protein kinase domain-containing protein n=1 Tax=Hermanssonia centrifuga TaxID=98765 RepID=A0A2R6NEU5_9APHY|nr:hypothetical protein PHLCEN_2v13591 [Hermanssonia centrifuga]